MVIESYLRNAVHEGTLEVRLPGGRRVTTGDGSGRPITVDVTSRLWAARIAAFPETALGAHRGLRPARPRMRAAVTAS
jgi:hypothetical protein